MNGINQVALLGRVGKEPTIKQINATMSVATVSVATTESFKNKANEWEEKTEWHNVVMWGALAERVGKSLQKGNMVYVSGKLSTRSWDDADGKKKYATEVICNSFINLTPKNQNNQVENNNSSQQPVNNVQGSSNTSGNQEIDDDLPF